MAKIVAGGAVGIALALCLLWYGFGIDILGTFSPAESPALSGLAPGNTQPLEHQTLGPQAEKGGEDTVSTDELSVQQAEVSSGLALPKANSDESNPDDPVPETGPPPAQPSAPRYVPRSPRRRSTPNSLTSTRST